MVKSIQKKNSDVKAIIKELKMPSNCKELSPTVVESEIWQFLERNIKSRDLGLHTVQKLLRVWNCIKIIRTAEKFEKKILSLKHLKNYIRFLDGASEYLL